MSKRNEAIIAFRNIDTLVERRTIPEPNSGCWLWVGALTGNGYAQHTFNIKGKPYSFPVHRAVLAKKLGRLPQIARHSCDTKICCNPDHLEDGTQQDNAIEWVIRGWRNGRKLTILHVKEIHESKDKGTVLAARYGVNKTMISFIKTGREWAHLFKKEI